MPIHIKVFCGILIAGFLAAGISAFFLVKKYYLELNLLRLDPLEEKSTGRFLLNPEGDYDIWLIGDSRIARWNADFFSPFGDSAINLGIEGQSTSQVLHRFKNGLEYGKPRLVFLEAGINDLKIIGLKKEMAPSIKQDCYNNITAIIDLCQEINVSIIVINIFPTGKLEFLRRFFWNSSVESAILETNANLRSYCSSKNIPYFDAYNFLAGNNFKVAEEYQYDFLHINEKAYIDLSAALINEFKGKYNIGDTLKNN